MLFSVENAPFILLGLTFVYFLVPYFKRWRLHDIPSPGLAAFTNFWLFIQTRQGKRFLSVDNAHKKYGKLVRIAPNHVSIADDTAVPAIYGHGNGFLKSYVILFFSYTTFFSFLFLFFLFFTVQC